MTDDSSDDVDNKHPPVDGVEYPEKPENASAIEIMQWMERVDHYYTAKGLEKLDSDDSTNDSENKE